MIHENTLVQLKTSPNSVKGKIINNFAGENGVNCYSSKQLRTQVNNMSLEFWVGGRANYKEE